MVMLAARIASADTTKPPEWLKLPDDKYHCTKYAPGWTDHKPLHVLAPPNKPMMFSIAATRRATYKAEGLPPGATLDPKTGVFKWQVVDRPGAVWKMNLFALNAGGSVASPLEIEVAGPDLVAAWKAGMGSYEPECGNLLVAYEFRDVDGDGASDLVYTTGDDKEGRSYETHIRRRLGERFDTVDRKLPAGSLEVVTTPDGKRAVMLRDSCCMRFELSIHRITPTGATELLAVDGSEETDNLEIERNAAGSVTAVIVRGTAYKWHGGRFE